MDIDISKLLGDEKTSRAEFEGHLEFKSPLAREEIKSKIKREDEEASSKIKREDRANMISSITGFIFSLFALATLGLFIYICYSIVTSPTSTAEDKKWAFALISAITGIFGGYIAGMKSKSV